MPIEKILVRSLIVLALIFLILALTFYPPSYAILPLIFLCCFIGAEFVLPNDSQKGKQGSSKIAVKVVVIFLSLTVLSAIAGLLTLWKAGHLWRLN